MRTFGHLVVLVTLWLLAWGEVSVANVLSGAAIATTLLVAFPWRGTAGSDIRLSGIGMARLGWYVVVQLVGSNIVMARQIVRPPSPTRPGVIAHHLEHPTADDVAPVFTSLHAQPVPWLDPAEITRAVLFFADEASAHISGTVLPIDAGNAELPVATSRASSSMK